MRESVQPTDLAGQLLDPDYAPRAFVEAGEQGNPRPNAIWCGSGEALGTLGLHPGTEVLHSQLSTVIAGRHVGSGAQVLPPGTVFDLVATAPNSLSFLWTQLPQAQRSPIEDAVLDSAEIALHHLMRNHPLVGGVRVARSFAAALVLHAVGTLSAKTVVPPMLHVHCCLFGVLDVDGRLRVPHEATLSDEDTLRETDAVDQVALADAVVQLGYGVRNTAGTGNHNFEVNGVPQELLDADFWENTGCAVAT